MKRYSRLILVSALFAFDAELPAAEIDLAHGLLAGELSATSVLLQTRLTAASGLLDGDVPGIRGTGRFEVSTSPDFRNSRLSPWQSADEANDFILRAQVDSLQPSTTYYYRAIYGPTREQTASSVAATFRTLPAADQAASIQFILTSCFNYAFFQHGGENGAPAKPEDRVLGYPALEPIRQLNPDFVILNGDCVYYDHPWETRAKTRAELRKKWHEQYVMPRFVQLFAQTATYWLKDDHDHRFNDSDATGDEEPSHQLGIDTFREQVPVVNRGDAEAVTYRTHRMGRDLQIWFVEGRDYRSPNNMPDGPEKSIWGTRQKEWLQRTLEESDATFKILISPTPMIGPDDAYKKDNHVNESGFRREGEAFFSWLTENGIAPGRFFILCGDRHWKYHSVHPSGFEEFSCGALNRENARLGRMPGAPKSSDPDAKIRQTYTDRTAIGGFLRAKITPAVAEAPATLEFIFHDDAGEPINRHRVP